MIFFFVGASGGMGNLWGYVPHHSPLLRPCEAVKRVKPIKVNKIKKNRWMGRGDLQPAPEATLEGQIGNSTV